MRLNYTPRHFRAQTAYPSKTQPEKQRGLRKWSKLWYLSQFLINRPEIITSILTFSLLTPQVPDSDTDSDVWAVSEFFRRKFSSTETHWVGSDFEASTWDKLSWKRFHTKNCDSALKYATIAHFSILFNLREIHQSGLCNVYNTNLNQVHLLCILVLSSIDSWSVNWLL